MSVLTISDLAMHFGAQDVFSGLSAAVARGDRVALVGANGAGKTTLLRIIAGLEQPSSGTVQMARGTRIGYLPQQTEGVGEGRLYDEMASVFAHLQAQAAELRRLEAAMADPATRDDVLARYGDLQVRFELAGGYDYENRIQRVLYSLGFREADLAQSLPLLSGGQRTRALLAKLLLSQPDLLLLDEPTNHLDMEAIEWLEETLASWAGSLIVVAHDRRFLDGVANRVWEMSFGRLEEYPGNYSQYVRLRSERHARRRAAYEAQQEEIAKTEEFIRRNMAGQRSKEAKGRLKRLERVDRLERPREERTLHLELKSAERAGEYVIDTRGLVVGYDDDAPGGGRRLFACPDLKLRRGERAALVGPNGSGKTTFLRTLLGLMPPLQGEVHLGYNVRLGYIAQAQSELQRDRTVLDEVLAVKDLPVGEARGFLGRFLFSGDDVFKPISALSGGEQARVALAKLTLQGANFLLLDEPTNHLDIASQEALQAVLERFGGTILFVSHDRWLIDALATQLWLVERDVLRVFRGGYGAYLAAKAAEAALEKDARTAQPREQLPGQQDAERALARERARRARCASALEEEISTLEEQLRLLQGEIDEAGRAEQVERLHGLSARYGELEARLQQRLDAWTQVVSGP